MGWDGQSLSHTHSLSLCGLPTLQPDCGYLILVPECIAKPRDVTGQSNRAEGRLHMPLAPCATSHGSPRAHVHLPWPAWTKTQRRIVIGTIFFWLQKAPTTSCKPSDEEGRPRGERLAGQMRAGLARTVFGIKLVDTPLMSSSTMRWPTVDGRLTPTTGGQSLGGIVVQAQARCNPQTHTAFRSPQCISRSGAAR